MSLNLLTEGTEIDKGWIVKSLNIYFGEFWEEDFLAGKLVLKLEIKQFTEDELQEFAKLFREYFLSDCLRRGFRFSGFFI